MGLRNTKASLRNLIIFAIVAVLLVGVFFAAYYGFGTNRPSRELTVEEAQALVDSSFDKIPRAVADGANYIFDNVEIKVLSTSVGEGKSLNFKCSYSSFDIKNTLAPELNNIFAEAYRMYLNNKANGLMTNSTKVSLGIKDSIIEIFENSADKKISGEITVTAYETEKGVFTLHLDRNIINTCTGGLQDVIDTVKTTETVNAGGQEVNISPLTTLRNGIKDSLAFNDYYTEVPNTGTAFKKAVDGFKSDFYRNFIEENRWQYLAKGLGTTLGLTGLSALLGVVLGFVVAIIRCTNQTTGNLKIIDWFCRLYLNVFRGTPLMVQLLIIYFIILLPIGIPKFIAAVMCFGLNSGAYVAEIVRGGIMAVDKGQMEAGRSLGFNYAQTMINFIIPQAFKSVLPALANEFITLLKESSVAFYLGVSDLTQGGLVIRSRTFSNFMPLIAVALIYLALVLVLTYLVGILERRLHKSDR